jgi:hypothetical protein
VFTPASQYLVESYVQVNKPLRQVTLVKQLWLSLICDPTFRTILELPPPDHEELGGLTAEGLMDLVKSAAIGPARSTPGAVLPHSRITFNTHTVPSVQAPRLLPGARYMVLRTMADLRIYETWSARLIWSHRANAFTIWEIDLVPGGAIARVLFISNIVGRRYVSQNCRGSRSSLDTRH